MYDSDSASTNHFQNITMYYVLCVHCGMDLIHLWLKLCVMHYSYI